MNGYSNPPFRSDYGRSVSKSKFSILSVISEYLSPSNPVDDLLKLRRFAKTILAVSAFFWSWAAYNTSTMKSGFDLGLMSFALSASSSGYLLTRRGEEPSRTARALVLLSHLAVAANYGLGALFAFTVGKVVYVKFAAYCVVFALLWLTVAYAGWRLVTLNIIAEAEEGGGDYDEDELEDMRHGFDARDYGDDDRGGRDGGGRRGDSYASYPYL